MRSRLTRYWWAVPLLVVYVLVVCEAYIRIVEPTEIVPRYVVAADWGVRMNKPSMTYHHTSDYYRVRFDINSKGVRANREIPYDKAADVFRIVSFGDSFGMGYEVELEDAWLSVLERELNASGQCQVEVVNLSVSGHGTAEELVTYLHEGTRYQPDLVIVQWHFTDLDDNVRARLYALENGELVERNKTYLPQVEDGKILDSTLYRLVAENSMFYSWARKTLSTRVKRFMAAKGNEDLQATTEAEEVEGGASESDAGDEGTPDMPSAKVQLSVALLERFAQEARQRGSAFMVVDVPSRIDRVTFTSSLPRPAARAHTVYSPIEDFGRHRGELLFWESDFGHFTPLGNDIVGKALARQVLPVCRKPATQPAPE